jgi:hypothetical protein
VPAAGRWKDIPRPAIAQVEAQLVHEALQNPDVALAIVAGPIMVRGEVARPVVVSTRAVRLNGRGRHRRMAEARSRYAVDGRDYP